MNQSLLSACLILCLALCLTLGLTLPVFAQSSAPPDAPTDRPFDVQRDLDRDIAEARKSLSEALRTHGEDSIAVGRARSQLGALLYLNREPLPAVVELRRAVATLEPKVGIFNAELVQPLGYLGLSLQKLNQHEAAADHLSRAQHITHRQLGMLNESQIPLVYSKADSVAAQGDLWQAEQLQYAVYRLHRHNFGPTSPETIGALNILGTWLTRAGRFRPALSAYREGLNNLKDADGNDTPEMAPLLEGMARTFLYFPSRQRGRSLNLLRRVTELTEERQDHFTEGDHLMANLQLADTLMIFSHERDALEYYSEAWQTWQEHPQTLGWAEGLLGARRLVAGPFEEIGEASAANRTYFRIAFDLRPDGRPSMVELLDTNARPSLVNPTITRFRAARFRPLIVDGEPMARPDQEIWLSYRFDGT
ncbi:MAG: tetratricopeptide repeat protein [Pseudomonadota bacterium]